MCTLFSSKFVLVVKKWGGVGGRDNTIVGTVPKVEKLRILLKVGRRKRTGPVFFG